jgi:hypothetical protein
MNERISQLKTAAEKVTIRSPEQFSEVFAKLMVNDLIKIVENIQRNEPGEVKLNMDYHLGWQIALSQVSTELQKYFK